MKTKILFIIPHLKIGGGAEMVTSSWTRVLSKKYDIYILTFCHFNDLNHFVGKYYSFKENIGRRKKIYNKFKLYFFIRPFKIYRFINRISPDVIITSMEYSNIITIATKFLFQIKTPLIISIHCNPLMQYEKKRKYFNFFIRFLYPSNIVDKIITLSNGVKEILIKSYKIETNKIQTIYSGIDLIKIQNMKEEPISDLIEIYKNKNLIKFITIGRLSIEKGHKYLIEAFYYVKKEIKNTIMIIRGDGPLKEYLEREVQKLGLHNSVIFLNKKQNIYNYLAKSDIFVLSSIYEGLPTVLLEALACGVPIISTDCQTGPSEILDNGKYGFLVKVKDTLELSKMMINLANNVEIRRKFSIISLERAQFFNYNYLFNEWSEILNNIR